MISICRGQQVQTELVSLYPHRILHSPEESRSDGVALHHVRGQSYALLDNVVSSTTGADGIATWDSLTLTASSSKFLYIMFYSEGTVASWNDPELRQPLPGKLARPSRYTSPIYIQSTVAQVGAHSSNCCAAPATALPCCWP